MGQKRLEETMATVPIEIRSRVVGGSREVPDLEPIHLDLLGECITVADLIRRTVEEQVHELTVRRKLDSERARRVLDRHYLTPDEVIAQAEAGSVRYPSERKQQPPRIDAKVEVRKALHAFQSGAYYVLVDGRQVERLDEEVELRPGSKVSFIRLMPLVGGQVLEPPG